MDADRARVSDAEREATVARLNAATGEGRLSLEEFGERASRAYAAVTQAELAKVTDDLPATVAPAQPLVVHHNPIGSVKRGGRWRLGRQTVVSTTVGAIKLDLTQVELAAPEVDLHVRASVGTVKVWITQGVRVEVDGSTFLGSRRIDEQTAVESPGAPVLRLRIDTGVGTVKVYRVDPDAWWEKLRLKATFH